MSVREYIDDMGFQDVMHASPQSHYPKKMSRKASEAIPEDRFCRRRSRRGGSRSGRREGSGEEDMEDEQEIAEEEMVEEAEKEAR